MAHFSNTGDLHILVACESCMYCLVQQEVIVVVFKCVLVFIRNEFSNVFH